MTRAPAATRPILAHNLARRKKTLLLTSMALPGALWLLLLRYLPMFGLVFAFQTDRIRPTLWDRVIKNAWTGFKNFEFLFTTSDSWRMVRNTIAYNAVWIVLGLVVSVAFAIILNEIPRKFLGKTYQTLMFFPYFISWVVVSYFVFAFLSPDKGLLTFWQRSLGQTPVDWYNTPGPWPYVLTLAYLWKNVGYSCILYLAAITGIDASQYEAAGIDGATKWQQVRFVTLPHLRNMIIILLIMSVGKIFNSDFGLFYNVPRDSGPLFSATQVVDTFVYRALAKTGNVGMSTAAGLFQNVVNFVVIMLVNTLFRKIDPETALF
ncbi:MAG: ABC transporter permease subunit [Oscillospiraceae bacterium]|nr:ABC transporter permease subunit [Oscillospiraceae bacterium]